MTSSPFNISFFSLLICLEYWIVLLSLRFLCWKVVFLFKRFGCYIWYLEAFCARFISMLLFNFSEIESIWGCSDSFIAWCLVVGLVANSWINLEYCAEKNSSFGEKNSFENKKLILGSKIWFESWISFKTSF